MEDNVEMAVKADRTVFGTLFQRRSAEIARRVDEILGIVRLGDHRRRMAGDLSHGQKQWLEIGMCWRRTRSSCWSTSPPPA